MAKKKKARKRAPKPKFDLMKGMVLVEQRDGNYEEPDRALYIDGVLIGELLDGECPLRLGPALAKHFGMTWTVKERSGVQFPKSIVELKLT